MKGLNAVISTSVALSATIVVAGVAPLVPRASSVPQVTVKGNGMFSKK